MIGPLKNLRRNVLMLTSIYVTALLVNYAWEMLQMPFFHGMDFRINLAVWGRCFYASFGDANIILGIMLLGALLFKNLKWPLKMNGLKYVYIFSAGGLIAVLIELYAIYTGRWGYSDIMPLFPGLKIGLVPFLQMIIMPLVTYKLVFLVKVFRLREPEAI